MKPGDGSTARERMMVYWLPLPRQHRRPGYLYTLAGRAGTARIVQASARSYIPRRAKLRIKYSEHN